jgi:hypothetical protein
MISTATAGTSAASSEPSTAYQATAVTDAIPMTIGTKTPATRSARRWIGASACASAASCDRRARNPS